MALAFLSHFGAHVSEFVNRTNGATWAIVDESKQKV
jgi:hypothetical protein